MKKFISLIMFFILSVSLISGCSCNDNNHDDHTHEDAGTGNEDSGAKDDLETEITPEDCTHTYSITIVEPTCVNKGYTLHVCSKCNHSFKDSYVDETNEHSGVGSCTICGMSFFTELTNYMIDNATYVPSGNYYGWYEEWTPYDVLWTYKPDKNQVEVSFVKTTSTVILFFITYYNNSDGVYRWAMNYEMVSSGTSFQMEGTLKANSITDNTTYLSYTASSFPSYLQLDGQKLAAQSYRANVGYFQSILDLYGGKSSQWGYTNLTLGGTLPQ